MPPCASANMGAHSHQPVKHAEQITFHFLLFSPPTEQKHLMAYCLFICVSSLQNHLSVSLSFLLIQILILPHFVFIDLYQANYAVICHIFYEYSSICIIPFIVFIVWVYMYVCVHSCACMCIWCSWMWRPGIDIGVYFGCILFYLLKHGSCWSHNSLI